MFTRAGSMASASITATAWLAKASLSSITSMSPIVRPARASTLRVASIGPMPMISGSHPETAKARIDASGSRPLRAA